MSLGAQDRARTKLDFAARVAEVDPAALGAVGLDWLMFNVGMRCNARCAHCHHSCGPTRSESMSADVMRDALELARVTDVPLIDVTGGSPELWPLFPEFIEHATHIAPEVRVRTNLIALDTTDGSDLIALLARRRVTLLASLPGTTPEAFAAQRGTSEFTRTVAVLERLLERGYGSAGGPALEVAYNPPVGGMPEAQAGIEARFERLLRSLTRDDVQPRVVVRSITNVPLGRAEAMLDGVGGVTAYVHRLADAFNAETVTRLACRRGIEVAWDGRLYDCDFNLAAGLGVTDGPRTVGAAIADPKSMTRRRLTFGRHCFACTAASGSS